MSVCIKLDSAFAVDALVPFAAIGYMGRLLHCQTDTTWNRAMPGASVCLMLIGNIEGLETTGFFAIIKSDRYC